MLAKGTCVESSPLSIPPEISRKQRFRKLDFPLSLSPFFSIAHFNQCHHEICLKGKKRGGEGRDGEKAFLSPSLPSSFQSD